MKEDGVEKLRGVVKDCVSKHLYSSAIFFADKVAALTGDPADIYMQAQALYLGRNYRQALHLLNSSQIVVRDLRFRYLAAKCLEELKEWHRCLTMLGDAKVDDHGNIDGLPDCTAMCLEQDGEDHEINILAAICFLRGKACEALENRDQARQWYKAAIKVDPFCFEALERLINNCMLTSDEELSLFSSLSFSEDDRWLDMFYSCLLMKHDRGTSLESRISNLENESCEINHTESMLNRNLRNNTDLLTCKAEHYHECGEYRKCFELTSALLERDPFHVKCTLVHIAAALELGQSNDLYIVACDLVKDYPERAVSWFAVGCYYHCIKKYDQAQKHFCKATNLDPTFPPAWLGFGNAYACQDESDQALAAFRTAARLFPGCHLPKLYMGMEYMKTHNFKLAEQFLIQAKTICPFDPLVYNELGVIAYHSKEYKKAVKWFEKTLSLFPSSPSEVWEATLVNHAHALRKLGRYMEAIRFYEKALVLSTRSLSSYAGLAYTYHQQGILDSAITYYHKALRLKPDDQFCTEMLTKALEDESHGPSNW